MVGTLRPNSVEAEVTYRERVANRTEGKEVPLLAPDWITSREVFISGLRKGESQHFVEKRYWK